MTDAKRTQIKKKVAAGQARNRTKTENTTTVFDRAGEAAIDAKDKFTAFAKQHPIATVAGGLAIGILIAGMFKAPRRAAIKGGSKAAGLAAIGAELAMAYAAKAYEAAKEAGDDSLDWLEDVGSKAGRRTKSLGSNAADYAADARDSVVKSGRSAARAVRGRLN